MTVLFDGSVKPIFMVASSTYGGWWTTWGFDSIVLLTATVRTQAQGRWTTHGGRVWDEVCEKSCVKPIFSLVTVCLCSFPLSICLFLLRFVSNNEGSRWKNALCIFLRWPFESYIVSLFTRSLIDGNWKPNFVIQYFLLKINTDIWKLRLTENP
jgi:hypothetical protein